ncbi:SNARE associated Golgi protein [Acidipropionibacterium jensenii]|uniref:SNARE associated Golgi protein n=1 Tax=Acidipropionibacterium jensenii TaxID=1749 RepID=A0A3S4V573_9ACTN|nr:VTT domain-containing protein [Acidipropionibacterium jensenii]VEI02192.1 SNARE associated Golgi protein [Acidipropionibacterium jensenii]
MVALEAAAWTSLRFWYEVLSAFGFGIASSLVPVLNSEIFIVGSLASGLLGPLEVSIGLALGHGVGKQIMFLAVRKGRQLSWFAPREKTAPPPGSRRERWRRWNGRVARMVENPRWGMPILVFSAITGIPPVYLVVIYSATTRMRFWSFSVWVTVGFFVRCLALALATRWGVHLVL